MRILIFRIFTVKNIFIDIFRIFTGVFAGLLVVKGGTMGRNLWAGNLWAGNIMGWEHYRLEHYRLEHYRLEHYRLDREHYRLETYRPLINRETYGTRMGL
jgi:hypothetical protein